MTAFQVLFGSSVAIAFGALILRQYRRAEAKTAGQGNVLFAPVLSLFDLPVLQRGQTAGVWTLTGLYRDKHFQLKTVVDTLATRKLPSLWLMVTLPEPLPLTATTDLMMRAAGVSSFSNFDFLPHTHSLPEGFPEQATIRSDDSQSNSIVSLMQSHLGLFHHGRGKELLISPNGLRIVVQLAEGDRARYGVFREANFAGKAIAVSLAKEIMDTLINLRNDILDNAKT
jgi:hypothetical protein